MIKHRADGDDTHSDLTTVPSVPIWCPWARPLP